MGNAERVSSLVENRGGGAPAGFGPAFKEFLQTQLFGFDFFISYRTADADGYATSLHAGLTAEGFDCFLDARHYEAGHNLPQMQSRALKRSNKLLVIVSPKAHIQPKVGTDWLLAE